MSLFGPLIWVKEKALDQYKKLGLQKLPEEKAQEILAKVTADGLAKSLDDDRDYVYSPSIDPTPIVKSNNRLYTSRIEDQLTLGSCTGNAYSYAAESIENTTYAYIPGVTDLSRLFAYQMAQKVDNLTGDVGATIRGAFKAGKLYGLPRESDYPYNLNQYGTEPSDAIKALAAQRKGGRYERIDVNKDNPAATRQLLDAALAEGCRVVMGFDVYRWMLYVTGAMNTHHLQPGAVNNGDPLLDFVGRHAIFIEDFDKSLNPTAGGSYIAVNSWGTSWGDGGRWAIPRVTIMNWAYEFWVLREFSGIRVGGPVPEVPLTQAQIADGRAWLVSRGLGRYVNGNFEYIGGTALIGNYVAGGASRRAGYSPTQYAQIINLPPGDVTAFMTDPATQALINAYAE